MTTTSGSLPAVAPEAVVDARIVPMPYSSRWLTGGAIVWLGVTFPLLTFPEVLWPEGRLIAAVVAAASAALAVALVAGRRHFGLVVALLAVLVSIAWLRVSAEKEALTHFTGVAVGILTMSVIAAWCSNPRRQALVVLAFLLAGLAALTLGLAGTTTQPFKLIALHPSSLPQLKLGLPGLPENGWVNPNALGGTALMIVPLAAALMLSREMPYARIIRIAAAATVFVGTAAVVIGQARTVWLASWLTVGIAVAWAVRNRTRRFVLLALIGLAPFLLVAATRGGEAVQPERILSEGRSATAFRAEIVWSQALEQLRSSPWLGIGLNHFRHAYRGPEWLREGTRTSAHAHNIFLQTALDIGIPGLIVYVALLALLLRRAAAAVRGGDGFVRQLALGSALGLIGVHLFGIGDAVSLGARVGLFQWMAAGFVLALPSPASVADAHVR